MTNRLKQVEEFWNDNLCGEHFINAEYVSEDYFKQYREFRYKKEHHLNCMIDWQSSKNKDVLEIGLGIGADGARWAAYARSYTGIDLTDSAVNATKRHFRLLSLNWKILKGNAESLPFEDNSFDIVYSHGVLHHTPSIMKALTEIFRVLRRNGEVILMLYSKNSFNYWLRVQFYFRLRFLFELIKYKFDLKITDPWNSHIKNLYKFGWAYFSWRNWHHHCTDGPECEIANVYYKSEIISLLENAGFKVKKMRKAHFPIGSKYPALELFLARYIGFYQFVWSMKE